MEAGKFEEKMREELEKREIKPSAGSWGELQEQLEQEKSEPRRNLWWIAAAAAIAGIFFVLGTFFNNPLSQETPVLVEKPYEEVVPEEKSGEPKEEIVHTTQKGEKQDTFQTEKLPEKSIVRQEPVVVSAEQEVQDKVPSAEEKLKTIIPVKVFEEAIAEISQPAKTEVQDSEIDALLKRATAEINANPTAYDAQTVDALRLLDEVEYELDQSFKQKVFEVVKEGISKAKSAVVSRNF